MSATLTDAALFDELYRLFGLGTFVDNGPQAWGKFRATQIVRIRTTREKRGVDVFDLIVTARWCKKRGIFIREHWQLYEHITDATRDFRETKSREQVRDIDEAISRAMAIEAQIPDSEWFDRLARASGKAREGVLQEWETFSSSRT